MTPPKETNKPLITDPNKWRSMEFKITLLRTFTELQENTDQQNK